MDASMSNTSARYLSNAKWKCTSSLLAKWVSMFSTKNWSCSSLVLRFLYSDHLIGCCPSICFSSLSYRKGAGQATRLAVGWRLQQGLPSLPQCDENATLHAGKFARIDITAIHLESIHFVFSGYIPTITRTSCQHRSWKTNRRNSKKEWDSLRESEGRKSHHGEGINLGALWGRIWDNLGAETAMLLKCRGGHE